MVLNLSYRLPGQSWINSSFTATTKTLTGLTEGATYQYRLRSRYSGTNDWLPWGGTSIKTFTVEVPILIGCGIIEHDEGLIDEDDIVYYDRFSNVYSETYFRNQPTGVTHCQNAGYFELEFINVPNDMHPIVCQVFTDLAQIIPQRSETNSCGQTIPSRPVRIEVMATINDDVTGGTGTPLFSAPDDDSCLEVALERPYIKINGGYPSPDNDAFDGLLNLNPTLNWNTDLNITSLPAGVVDLYQVVLHEAMHILGYASRVHFTSVPNPASEAYSLWDQQLFFADNYDPTGNTIIQNPMITNNGISNCWNLSVPYTNFRNSVLNNCSTSSFPEIVVGNTGIAPIAGAENGVDATNVDNLRQMTSHLNSTCNGQNNISYLMASGINTLVPYNPIRDITEPELQILCELGYQITSNNFTCNGCFVISHFDPALPRDEDDLLDCCVNRFYSCIGEDLIINQSELLCNDISNGNINELDVTRVFLETSDQSSFVNITPNGDEFIINSSLIPDDGFSIVDFHYTARSCDGKVHNGRFSVDFDICPACDNTPCDNLFCVDDFEGYPSENTNLHNNENFGIPFKFSGTFNNTPDIITDPVNSSNKTLFLGSFNEGKETVAYELTESIQPNCKIRLSLDASGSFPPPNASVLNVWGSEFAPCDITDVFVNYGCGVPTNCENYIYNPICIGTIPIDNARIFEVDPVTGGTVLIDLNLQTKLLEWTNIEGIPINYIILSPDGSVDLDNISLTKSCINPDFTNEILCPGFTVNFTSLDTDPINTHLWNFGDGNTSTQINPSHQYASNGTYTATHTVTDNCGNMETSTMDINVDCGTQLELCDFPNAFVIGSGVGLPTSSSLPVGAFLDNDEFIVKGVFTINDGGSFVIGEKDFYFEPGAQMELELGGSIIFSRCNFQGCGQMWQGIRVKENQTARFIDCVLEDAEYAIWAEDNTVVRVERTIFNRNFVGFYVASSINQTPQNVSMAFSTNIFDCTSDLSPIYPNALTSPGTKSYAGILVNDLSLLNLPSLNPLDITQRNEFRNLTNGIVSRRSNVLVGNTVFLNIHDDPSNPQPYDLIGHGIYANGEGLQLIQEGMGNPDLPANGEPIPLLASTTNFDASFNNCTIGITADHINSDISGNLMLNVGDGIVVSNSANADIHVHDNSIASSSRGIWSAFNDPVSTLLIEQNFVEATTDGANNDFGIQVDEFGNEHPEDMARIENNTIKVLSASGGINVSGARNLNVIDNQIIIDNANSGNIAVGISCFYSAAMEVGCNHIFSPTLDGVPSTALYVFNSGESSSYDCNTFQNTMFGAYFGGDCTDTDFKTNVFGDHHQGLRITNTAMFSSPTGAQDNTGNSWVGNYTWGVAAQHDGTFANVVASEFIVPYVSPFLPSPPQDLIHTTNAEWDNWFTEASSGSQPLDCDPDTNCDPGADMILDDVTEMDLRIAEGELMTAVFTEQLHWSAQQSLYSKLRNNDGLVNMNDVVKTFFNDCESLNTKDFHDVKDAIQNALKLDNTSQSSLKSNANQIKSHLKNVEAIDAALANAPEQAYNGLLNAKSQILKKLKTVTSAQRQLANNIKNNKNNLVDQIYNANSPISINKIYESNLKMVNAIYLKTIAKGITNFNSTDQAILQSIANQCPFEGGVGVYRARSLYSLVESVHYDNENLCGGLDNSLMKPEIKDEVSVDNNRNKQIGNPATTNGLDFSLYPNPANNEFILEYPSEIVEAEIELVLYDLMGKQVVRKMSHTRESKMLLDISSLNNGIYICKVSANNKVIFSDRLVIIH